MKAAAPAPLVHSEAPATAALSSWRLALPRGRTLALGGRPLVMGVLNLTPDSFSDGGRFWSAAGHGIDPEPALAQARALLGAGADLLDLGAESTRPAGRAYGCLLYTSPSPRDS